MFRKSNVQTNNIQTLGSMMGGQGGGFEMNNMNMETGGMDTMNMEMGGMNTMNVEMGGMNMNMDMGMGNMGNNGMNNGMQNVLQTLQRGQNDFTTNTQNFEGPPNFDEPPNFNTPSNIPPPPQNNTMGLFLKRGTGVTNNTTTFDSFADPLPTTTKPTNTEQRASISDCVLIVLFIIAWTSFTVLLSISVGGLRQRYEWPRKIEDCQTNYTATVNEIYYHGRNSTLIKAVSIDDCKPKYTGENKVDTYTCFVNPKNETEIRLFPLYNFSSQQAATAFMVILCVGFNLPILISGFHKKTTPIHKFLMIPGLIIFSPFVSLFLPCTLVHKHGNSKKIWALYPLLVGIGLVMILTLTVVRPANNSTDKLEDSTCKIEYQSSSSYDITDSPYAYPLTCSSALMGDDDSYSGFSTKYWLKVSPTNYPQVWTDTNMYKPYMKYPFSTYKALNSGDSYYTYSSTYPQVGDTIECWIEKQWSYDANNHTYPDLHLRKPNDYAGVKVGLAFSIISGIFYGLAFLMVVGCTNKVG